MDANLGDGQFPAGIRPADDVRQGGTVTSGSAGAGRSRRRRQVRGLQVRLKRSQSRRSCVLEREVAKRRQLVAHRPESRGVSGSGDGGVVRGRRQRIMGEGRRRGCGGVG